MFQQRTSSKIDGDCCERKQKFQFARITPQKRGRKLHTALRLFPCEFALAFQLRRERNIWTDARQIKSWRSDEEKLLLTCRQTDRDACELTCVYLHLLWASEFCSVKRVFAPISRYSCMGINFFSLFARCRCEM